MINTNEFADAFKTWPEFSGYPDGIKSVHEMDIALQKFQQYHSFSEARFRGEPKYYDSHLQPKVARKFIGFTPVKPNSNISREEIREIRLAQLYKIPLLFRLGLSSATWISVAQHYGRATRLLDISTDYHVALFYACIDESLHAPCDSTRHGYVFMFPPSSYRPMSKVRVDVRQRDIEQGIPDRFIDFFEPWEHNPVYVNVGHFFQPIAESKGCNKRIQAQKGEFIWWHPLNSKFPGQVFPVRVNGNSKRNIICELGKLGYSAATLYPDEYGRKLQQRIDNNITTA